MIGAGARGHELHPHVDRDVHGRGQRGGRPAARPLSVPFLRRTTPAPRRRRRLRIRGGRRIASLPQGSRSQGDAGRILAASRASPSVPINLAVLKSLKRAEYTPEQIGHFALASQHYATSPRPLPPTPTSPSIACSRPISSPRTRPAMAGRSPEGPQAQARGHPVVRRPGGDRAAHQLHPAPRQDAERELRTGQGARTAQGPHRRRVRRRRHRHHEFRHLQSSSLPDRRPDPLRTARTTGGRWTRRPAASSASAPANRSRSATRPRPSSWASAKKRTQAEPSPSGNRPPPRRGRGRRDGKPDRVQGGGGGGRGRRRPTRQAQAQP